MDNEINAVINNLCEKLGTTAYALIPEIAKRETAQLAAAVLIELMVFIVCLSWLPRAWRYDHREDKDWSEDSMWTLLPGIVGLFAFIALATSITSLVGWIASPTASAVTLIVSMLK